jgi:hypothetical protein
MTIGTITALAKVIEIIIIKTIIIVTDVTWKEQSVFEEERN